MPNWLTRISGGSTRLKMVLALLAGLAAGLGHAPFSWVLFALAGLLAGFYLLQTATSLKQATLIGWAVGAGYFGLVLIWIIEPFLVDAARHGWMAPFALIGMAGGMALFWAAAFGMAYGRHGLWRGAGLVVFLTLAEVARTYILTGFPWGLIGYIWLDTGVDFWASVIGPHGIILITLVGVWGLVTALNHRKRIVLVPAVGICFAAAAFIGDAQSLSNTLYQALNSGPHEPKIIRLLQPNAPQHQKWDRDWIPVFFGRQLEYSSAQPQLDRAPDLIIWPETAVPYLINDSPRALEQISRAANGVPVVFGGQRNEGKRYFNSLAVLNADGVLTDIYDKSHLVPFGEYVPGGKLATMVGINGFIPEDGFGYSPGSGLRLIDIPGMGRMLPLICYEAIFPHAVGGLSERADWMLQITNDAWFGQAAGPLQHLAQARMRSIEQGLPMVRVANTGVSAVINASGGITASLPMGQAGYLDVALPRAFPPTFYARTGDLPALLLLFGIAFGLLFKRFRFKH